MLLKHLESLRAHGEWADAHLLRAVEHAAPDVAEVIRELAHVRGAQDTWLARIQRRDPTIPVWPEWCNRERACAPCGANGVRHSTTTTNGSEFIESRLSQ